MFSLKLSIALRSYLSLPPILNTYEWHPKPSANTPVIFSVGEICGFDSFQSILITCTAFSYSSQCYTYLWMYLSDLSTRSEACHSFPPLTAGENPLFEPFDKYHQHLQLAIQQVQPEPGDPHHMIVWVFLFISILSSILDFFLPTTMLLLYLSLHCMALLICAASI